MIGDGARRSASVLSDGNWFQKEKDMSQERGISRVVNVPPAAPGFVGPGHLAAPVVSPENFEMTDPFILLMDDHLDIGNRPVGGPHVVCVSLGLRISECLALMWSDVDWLNGALLVQRGIVIGRVAETKTEGSRRSLTLAPEILAVLKTWKMSTQFGSPNDWVFASPSQLGRLPWSYPWTWKMFQDAAVAAKLETFGTHTLRHTYRSWLDAVGTTIAVEQKLMRHADIRTTMNVYGTVVTDEMATASGKVARLKVNGTGSGTGPTPSH